jgi:hypothetical protein
MFDVNEMNLPLRVRSDGGPPGVTIVLVLSPQLINSAVNTNIEIILYKMFIYFFILILVLKLLFLYIITY